MKILMLHLSDIHFENMRSYSKTHLNAIVNAVGKHKGISTVFVIVSGDIAYSGKQEQYNTSWKFLSTLREKMRGDGEKKIEFAVVPGNHDVDYDKGKMSAKELVGMYEKKQQDEFLAEECEKMRAFYNHAKGLACFENKKELVYNKVLEVEGVRMRLILINSAVFSSLDEDQGLHYLPSCEIEKIARDETDDFVFTVMHHPHHWYNSCMKKRLEKELFKVSDIIFVGHEHYASSMQIEMENYEVEICAGGELSDRGVWEKSEFHIGVLDCSTREYEMWTYKWNMMNSLYVCGGAAKKVLGKKRVNKHDFYPKRDFCAKMFADEKYMITDDFSEYFVFPRLEEEVSNEKRMGVEVLDMGTFICNLEKRRKIILFGKRDGGKTTLLKQIFKTLIETKCAIYIDKDTFRRDYDQAVRMVFSQIYTEDGIKYEAFKQIEKGDKVLLIDDVESYVQRDFEAFLERAEREFGYIILSTEARVEFDMKERIRKEEREAEYARFRIMPFFKDKRRELINKLVGILVKQDSTSQENIAELLCVALSKQKKLYHMEPEFIVRFTKYYCNNIGETIQNDGEIFSKVFESNIVSLIKPFAAKMSVDKIMTVLDKIAYQMHVSREYPMSQKGICEVINTYNDDFDSEIDYIGLLNTLENAKILTRIDTRYRFCERTYLAYFAAREIKRKCIEEADYSEFEKALEYSCYGINADIVLFVTYITDNLILIRKIMEKAIMYMADWDMFSIAPVSIPYLSDVGQLEVRKVAEHEIENNERREIEDEKRGEEIGVISPDSIYNYEENELDLLRKLIRGISLLVIISRMLPGFEHIMKKEDKTLCVRIIYTMPLQLFNVWAREVEDNKLKFIDDIKELSEWKYKKEEGNVDDTDALNFLRWQSMSLLLELIHASMSNATKDNTHRYLDSFNYDENGIFQIEHLMGLSCRDKVEEVVNEAERLFESQSEQLPKLLIQRVARQFIISSKRIQRKHIQRLNAKLWEGRLNQTAIIIEKDRKRKREQ